MALAQCPLLIAVVDQLSRCPRRGSAPPKVGLIRIALDAITRQYVGLGQRFFSVAACLPLTRWAHETDWICLDGVLVHPAVGMHISIFDASGRRASDCLAGSGPRYNDIPATDRCGTADTLFDRRSAGQGEISGAAQDRRDSATDHPGSALQH